MKLPIMGAEEVKKTLEIFESFTEFLKRIQ
jgi:hypothetical protein